MTDREKKQGEILGALIMKVRYFDTPTSYKMLPECVEAVRNALSELAKLDAIPTSKEVEEAVKWAEFEIKQLEWVRDLLPLDKIKKREDREKLLPDYERAEKRIEAQKFLIDNVREPLEKLDEEKQKELREVIERGKESATKGKICFDTQHISDYYLLINFAQKFGTPKERLNSN